MAHGHCAAKAPQPRHHYAYVAFDERKVAARPTELATAWTGRLLLVSLSAWLLQPALRAVLRKVTHERVYEEVALRAALHLLIVEAARLFRPPTAPVHRVPGHPAIARARVLLDEQPGSAWTLETLAAAVGLSRAHLSDLFASDVGQPPYANLLDRRIEQAMPLLPGSSRTVSQIAADSGFNSGSTMARTFGTIVGCSTAQWRRQSSMG